MKKQKPTTPAGADLPSLSSGAPKLNHLCSDRPRRMKTRAVTRPTVGLTHAEDSIDEAGEDDVDTFFTSPAGKSLPSVSSDSNIVNGELEKG